VTSQYVIDPGAVPWKPSQVAGITFKCQVLLDGADGGPEAIRFRFDPCPSVFAHMHLTSQFQLLLRGRMHFPKATMKLGAVAAHYTDHNFPYGPFSVAEEHDMLVLHPKRGGLVTMSDRSARKQINLEGRHLYGAESEAEWVLLPEYKEARCKALIRPGTGPSALMIEYPSRAVIDLPGAPYGRYDVVLKGSVTVGSCCSLFPPGFRYVVSDKRPDAIEAGENGATLMLLSFDRDALEGGLTGEGLSVAAAEAMERAI
jgi:hypothetical protein